MVNVYIKTRASKVSSSFPANKQPNMRFLLGLLFALLLLTFVHHFAVSEITRDNKDSGNGTNSNNSSEAQQMCLDIQSGKRYLLVVGLMPAGLTPTFVMISISSRSSEDYYAHALPPSALNTAIPVLFISNEAGAPLETKWPLLYQTMAKYFFKADQLITLQITGGRDTVYMPNPQKGIAYDISGNSSGHPEQLINLTGARPVDGRWISSAERLTFYSLVNDQHQQRLCKYTFDEKEDANGTYRVNQASPYYYICKGKSDDDQKVVRVLETECRQTADSSPVSWSILNGFADETRLYLFEENRVHILPLSALNGSFTTTTTATAAASSVDDRLSVSVATHPLSSFIHCPGQPMPTVPPPTTTTTTLPSNDSSPTGADKNGSSEVSLGLFIVLGVIILLVLFVIPTVLVFTYLFCCKGGRSKGGSTKRASTGTAGEGNAAAASQASVAKQGTKVNNSSQWSATAKGGGSKSGSSKRRRKTQGGGFNKTAPNATTSNVSVSGTSSKKSTKSTRRRQKGKGSGRGSGKVAAAAAAGASVMSTKSRGSKQSRKTKTKTPASTSSKKKGSRRKKKKNKKAMGTSNKSTKTVASSRKQKQRSTSKK